MKKGKTIIFISFILFLSCNSSKKEYKKYCELFIDSYNSLNYEKINSEYNKKEISNTYHYLDKMIEYNKSSNEKHFFDLLKFRLLLIEGKYFDAITSLEEIKDINPMMYYFYIAATYEIMQNNISSLENYNISLSECDDSDFCTLIDFFIHNNFNTFLNNLEQKMPSAYTYYNMLKTRMSETEIRKKILIDKIFHSYRIPNLPEVYK
jgi:tetratricopeptide (TPR) repeat protein|tara:strand:+ start:964 stop:1584 length:621 start_codon:yes stop_codon:yes gene_type:complete